MEKYVNFKNIHIVHYIVVNSRDFTYNFSNKLGNNKKLVCTILDISIL